ncbi:MAG: YdcF family protein [Magnetovibrionaceae bacterium]
MAIALVWAGGLFVFAESLPLGPKDVASRTDAIVVLTGGSGRLEAGIDLLIRDKADQLFVSGVFPGVDVARLLRLARQTRGDLSNRIAIGDAEDTVANARETVEWLRKSGFKSIRLVTSAYHMPRARIEFARVGPEIDLIEHPVLAENVRQEDWWAWPGTTALIMGEYNKFLVAWAKMTLEREARKLAGTASASNEAGR